MGQSVAGSQVVHADGQSAHRSLEHIVDGAEAPNGGGELGHVEYCLEELKVCRDEHLQLDYSLAWGALEDCQSALPAERIEARRKWRGAVAKVGGGVATFHEEARLHREARLPSSLCPRGDAQLEMSDRITAPTACGIAGAAEHQRLGAGSHLRIEGEPVFLDHFDGSRGNIDAPAVHSIRTRLRSNFPINLCALGLSWRSGGESWGEEHVGLIAWIAPRDDPLIHVARSIVDKAEQVAQPVKLAARGVHLRHEEHSVVRRPVRCDHVQHL